MGFLSDIFGGGDAPQAVQFNPFDVNSGLGSATFGDGSVNLSLDPRLQGISNGLFSQGQGLLGQAAGLQNQGAQLSSGLLSGVNSFDPVQNAQQQFALLQSIRQPFQQQQRGDLEAQLLRQGRLGSTGGSNQQGAFEGAIQNQQSQDLFNSLQQAMGIRGMQLQQALGAEQAGSGLFGQGSQAINQGINIEQIPLAFASLGGQLGGQQMGADQFNSQQQFQFGQSKGAFGRGLLSGAAGGLVSGGMANLGLGKGFFG